MKIVFVCPVPAGSRLGNRITAERWRDVVMSLGHEARVVTDLPRTTYDVLVALHAYRTADAVRSSRDAHPERPVVVALTGTDLNRDIHVEPAAQRSLVLADRIVVLHDQAKDLLPREARAKVRLIRQSAPAVRGRAKSARTFDVAFVAHLRDVKDPLRAAMAARLLPSSSRVRIVHAGAALTPAWAQRARAEAKANARYVWLGDVAPMRARRLIASSRLLVLTSVAEGGANVLGEAIVSGTPVIASRIPAAVSALGRTHPGLFETGDTRALARLLARAESDPAFYARLTSATRARRRLFAPSAEKAAWRSLLGELARQMNEGRSPRSM